MTAVRRVSEPILLLDHESSRSGEFRRWKMRTDSSLDDPPQRQPGSLWLGVVHCRTKLLDADDSDNDTNPAKAEQSTETQLLLERHL